MRRSILTKSTLKAGTKITIDNIVFKRPGKGMPPSMVNEIIGRKLKFNKEEEEVILAEELE